MNLAQIVDYHAALQPDAVALRFGDRAFTFHRLKCRIDRASAILQNEWGLRVGDRVAWLGLNHPDMLTLLFACARIGAILAPLNHRLAPAELGRILAMVEPSVLVHDDAHAQASAQFGLAAHPLDAIVDHYQPLAAVPVEDGGPLDCLLVTTSGTTGEPKGAVHTQSALRWNMVAGVTAQQLTAADHVLTCLPMLHVGGLCIQTLPALHAGAAVTLHARFDAGAWLADVARLRPSLSLLVPAAMRAVIEHAHWHRADLSSLLAVWAGSSTIPMSLIDAFHARGIPLCQVYGATETGPITTVLPPGHAVRKAGCAGWPSIACEVRLAAEDGSDAAPGAVGEMWVRGANVMRGYWRQDDHPAFRDGWFRSGDLATRDDEGCFTVVGRSKDMIISGGENIYPAEIENLLADLPGAAECSVIGMPDIRWGEAAVAVIVRRKDAAGAPPLDEAGVLAHLDGRIARFKIPRRVVFVEALPKTALGKVLKPALRALLDARPAASAVT